MKVAKFGGSSLASGRANKENLRHCHGPIPQRRLVVVSAPGKRDLSDAKVTDLLIEVVRAQLTNQDGRTALAHVIDRYAAIVGDLGLPDSVLAPIVADFERRLAMSTSDPSALRGRHEGQAARTTAPA